MNDWIVAVTVGAFALFARAVEWLLHRRSRGVGERKSELDLDERMREMLDERLKKLLDCEDRCIALAEDARASKESAATSEARAITAESWARKAEEETRDTKLQLDALTKDYQAFKRGIEQASKEK